MRRLISTITAVMIVTLLLATSVSAAFAEEQLTINDEAKVNVGDTVKFTLNLSETKEDIIGFELRLFYDPDCLEFQQKSLTSEKFDNLFYNPDIDGKIPMNWTDIGNPVSFAKKDEFFSCEFKVLKGGDAKISYFVTEMYGEDMTYLKSYKWTYDLSVGGEAVLTDGVLPITDDKETLESRQSSFINYVDGMGEENSPNAGDHEAVTGAPHETYQVYEQDVIEATKFVDVSNPSGGAGWIPVLIAIPVLGGLIAAAIIIIMKNKNKAVQEETSTDSDNN